MGLFSGQRPANLGAKDGRLAPCPRAPNCVSSQADGGDAGHHVAPLEFAGEPRGAWAALRAAVAALPRTTIVTESGSYLHAECATQTLGFVDDLECLLEPRARLIHVRSAARLGYSDFGVNRARVEALRAALRDAGA